MGKAADRINKEKLKQTLASMAALFEKPSGVKHMKDLISMYPTGVVAALGINYGGYISKCIEPQKFVISDIVKLSKLLNVDIELIWSVVARNATENMRHLDMNNELK